MVAPVLAIPKENEQFEFYADSNAVSLGAMWAQGGKAVDFAARTLNATERN